MAYMLFTEKCLKWLVAQQTAMESMDNIYDKKLPSDFQLPCLCFVVRVDDNALANY